MKARTRPAKALPNSSFAPRIVVPPPGPKARRILERDRRVITPAYTRAYPFVMDRGEGSFAWDPDGNRYLDFTAGVAVNALGHAHPEIVRAVEAQARRFLHMAGTDFYYEVMAAFAEKLCDSVPGDFPKQCFLANSGTEAIEAALKLARYATRRTRLIAFYGCFHGRSMGSLSLTASKAVQRRHFGPLLPDVSHAPFGDLEFIEKYLFRKTTPPEDVAAIFVEPIQGEGGYHVAPPGFLAGLRKLCDRHGILLVADEIQTGLGRTGRLWAVEHDGVIPDILCCAKPVGGGLPLGAMVARKDLQTWPPGAHANTFGGNPLACAAGLKTIELLRSGLLENVRAMGDYLGARLSELAEEFPHVASPRGRGLMRAVDIVHGRSGAPDPERRNRVVQAAFRRGLLLLGCGETGIRFLPALNIEKGHVDAAVAVLREALSASS
ncbi:MAG TPA: acetyl ornithine aminotransferase family protein [Planctomycetota bacterium]|nr:acetyl ornithine aminotransferase family protein [Planctomycetota bacterium]